MAIPYGDINTLFLDVGGTLVAIDYGWVCQALAAHGCRCDPDELHRAEAAARPIVSAILSREQADETVSSFDVFLRTILERVLPAAQRARIPELCRQLVPVLLEQGNSQRLWSLVLPGAREALEAFAELGLRMVAVSNSDGTVEAGLARQGLRGFFHAVVDSHVVGFEKPDRRIFEHALRLSGAEPARTLHVGDMYFADVIGARRASVHAALLDPFDDWGELDCPRFADLMALHDAIAGSRG
ncbi:MAG: HAD family hydrolase [Planctomycetota bacterium]|jgi:HAD superfamily hydrolase (TIGR01509 family)